MLSLQQQQHAAVVRHRVPDGKNGTCCLVSITPPLSVPVSSSPVSREASRDFVELDMWLHTRYQMSKVNFWHHMVYTWYIFILGFGLHGLGITFYFWIRGVEIRIYSILVYYYYIII